MHLRQSATVWDRKDEAPVELGSRGFINHLRFVALGCRSKARTDLFRVCAVLSSERSQSIQAYSEALMLCINDALEARAVLFRPGTREHSFDEAWLVQLANCLQRGEEASVRFLLCSRVKREYHRNLRFLVSRISEQFGLG